MAQEQTALVGESISVLVNVIDSTGSHVAATINTTQTRIDGFPATAPTVTTVNTGIYRIVFSGVSPAPAEGDRLVVKVNGDISGTAWTEYGIPVKILANDVSTFDEAVDAVITDSASRTASQANVSGLSTFDPSTTTVDVGKINGNATSASNLQKSTLQMIQGTVAGTPTPTNSSVSQSATFGASDITNSEADTYIGRLIVFTSGTLSGQATDITDYAYDSGNSVGFFTTTNLTQAPSQNDTFIIV